eukprot:6182554-Pleurochrysis_carterae.AAC.2
MGSTAIGILLPQMQLTANATMRHTLHKRQQSRFQLTTAYCSFPALVRVAVTAAASSAAIGVVAVAVTSVDPASVAAATAAFEDGAPLPTAMVGTLPNTAAAF